MGVEQVEMIMVLEVERVELIIEMEVERVEMIITIGVEQVEMIITIGVEQVEMITEMATEQIIDKETMIEVEQIIEMIEQITYKTAFQKENTPNNPPNHTESAHHYTIHHVGYSHHIQAIPI
ncbi:hypothetical protein THOM_2224 [Trachipleistophora hominis]|uniref:Uncharacterized protein n=1 Tax=Trachipleistophora hominis TaxID=72359 RepID=L7JVS3_TRAHO|nr:hypothetical protein THOM_2224 [Trachipleistophora hominis]